LEALLAKATPGPWAVHPRAPSTVLAGDGYSATNTDSNLFDAYSRNINNAALIAEAINALPALLRIARAVVEAPRAEVGPGVVPNCAEVMADNDIAHLIGVRVLLVRAGAVKEGGHGG
jgi:hypothetical protein